MISEHLKDQVQKALDYDKAFDFSDINKLVEKGKLKIFQNKDGVLITHLVPYPKKKILSILLGAGTLDKVLSLVPKVEDYAKENGCTELIFAGRKGWEKVLPDWKFKNIMMKKSLNG